MNKLEELFRWRLAYKERDTGFIPSKCYRRLGFKFVTKKEEYGELSAGTVVTLHADDDSNCPWFTPSVAKNRISIFWVDLAPYYKEYDV